MKKLFFNVLALSAMVLVWSCGPKISSSKSTGKDLDNYKTYAYLPNSNFEAPDNVEQSKDVGNWIIDAVNNNMQRAGYTMNRSNPDLLVVINSNYNKESNTYVNRDYQYANYPYTTAYGVSPYYQNYYYNGYRNYSGIVNYDVNVNKYTDAALIINVVDRNTKNIVWTGSAKDFENYQKKASREVAESVDNIFSNYPTIAQK